MNPLQNPQSAALMMVAALQRVVSDNASMTEEGFNMVLAALSAAGVDPFPAPKLKVVRLEDQYDGNNWAIITDKKHYLVNEKDGEIARYESEEIAEFALDYELKSREETDAMFRSPSGDRVAAEPMVSVPRSLLDSLAPEDGLIDGEFGNCMHCSSADYRKYPSPNGNFYQHSANCDWMAARKILCETAEATVDADGMISDFEMRNYLRGRGFNVVSKYCGKTDEDRLFAYLPTEEADERKYVDTFAGLEAYFLRLDDDQPVAFQFVRDWCEARETGKPNISRWSE